MNQIITNKLAIIIIKSLRVVPAVNSRPVLADRGILCCRLSVMLCTVVFRIGEAGERRGLKVVGSTTSYEFLTVNFLFTFTFTSSDTLIGCKS